MSWTIRALAAIACALAFPAIVLAQDPGAESAVEKPAAEQQVEPKPEATPALPAPPVIDGTARFDQAGFEAALGAIAAAYPDLVRVRSLGKSRGGRDVWLAVAADDPAGEAGRRPAAVVITDLEPGEGAHPPGPEAALFALSSLLERARAEPGVRERLQRCALYFLPAPDPDGAFAASAANGSDPGQEPRRFRLDRNFPAGWEPYEAESGATCPYPLSEPESRMLARFLLERVNLSTLIVLDGTSVPGEPAGAAPGSLEAFCAEVLDGAVLRVAPWKGEARTGPVGSGPEGFFEAAATVAGVLDDLPRLECGAPKIERLRPEVWLVDLPLSNTGKLPTHGKGDGTTAAGSVQLRTSGGRVVACAVQAGEGGTYEAVRGTRGTWPIGHVGGKASVVVRLVVESEEGKSLEAVFESPRGGKARVLVELK